MEVRINPLSDFTKNASALKYSVTPYGGQKHDKVGSFLTEVKNCKRSSKAVSCAQPGEIKQCYSELSSYMESFDHKLGRFLSAQEDACVKKYKEFVEVKNYELNEIQRRLESTIGEHAQSLKDQQIRRNYEEIAALYKKLRSFATLCTTLDKENKRLKLQLEHAEDENKFLRTQLKTRISENSTLQLLLKLLGNILSEIKDELAKCESNEERCENLTNVLDTLKKTLEKQQKQNVPFAAVLELYTQHTPQMNPAARTPSKKVFTEGSVHKRSVSTIKKTPESAYQKHIDALSAKNASLEKRIVFLKARMGATVAYKRELEEIFIDCVERAKKEIYKRKLKLGGLGNNLSINLVDPKVKLEVTNDVTSTVKKLKDGIDKNSVKLKDFNTEDKLNLVTLFVCNDKIVHHIYDLLFPKYATSPADQTLVHEASDYCLEQKAVKTYKYSRLPVSSVQKLLESPQFSRNNMALHGKSDHGKRDPRKHMRMHSGI